MRRTLIALLAAVLIGPGIFAQPKDKTAGQTTKPAQAGGDHDAVPGPAETEKKLPGASEPAPALGAGMKKTGPATWEITRDEAYQMVASIPFIAMQLWVREVKREGKLVGYKLKHIKEGSLVHQAGFRNGDILKRVNAQGLGEPMKLLLGILDADRVEIDLERGGKALKLVYKFVP